MKRYINFLRFLHALGFHSWKYSNSIKENSRYRRCRICYKKQMYDDYAGEWMDL